MSIAEKQERVVAEFSGIPEWEDRYKRIIALGRDLPAMPEALKTDDKKVRGCSSTVWLHANGIGDRVEYVADSDALIVRGLIALLIQVYSGEKAEEILAAKPQFIEQLGLNAHLSPNRANGLSAMVMQIKKEALNVLMAAKRRMQTET
jgi:cysteine desulfuration protein SufE